MDNLEAFDPSEYEGPAVVHLKGRTRVAGRVRSVVIAGGGFLRIDIPEVLGPPTETGAGRAVLHPARTLYRSPGAIRGIDPVDEATMHTMAALWRPEPVDRREYREARKATEPPRSPSAGIPGHDFAQEVDFGEDEDRDPRGHEAGDDDDDDDEDFDQETAL